MNPVTGLSLGRIAVGSVALAAPDLAAKSLQLDAVTNPQVPYVLRLFGIREIALGLVGLIVSGRTRRGVIGIGIAVDAADAATGYLAMQDGSISKKSAYALMVPAAGAVGSGLMALFKR